MNGDLEFRITLKQLKTLCDCVCELDGLRPPLDVRLDDLTRAGHLAIITALGEQVGLVYAMPEPDPIWPVAPITPRRAL